MPKRERSRGAGIALPAWWLKRVNELYVLRGDTMAQLGKDLARVLGRPDEFTHGVVSRFLSNDNTTMEVAEAFSMLYGLPPPFFMARTEDEAHAIRAISMKFGPSTVAPQNEAPSNPDRDRKLAIVDQVIEAEGIASERHRQAVASKDEGTGRGGRPRRAARRRASSS